MLYSNRTTYNQQVCGQKNVDVGLNAYSLSNQKPNNPLDMALANIKHGVATGNFIKQVTSGPNLPNPIAELKNASTADRARNPPDYINPRENILQRANQARQGVIQIQGNLQQPMNQLVRREEINEQRINLRGRMNVAQRPNIVRREIERVRREGPGDGPIYTTPPTTPQGQSMTPGMNTAERKAFTFSPFQMSPGTVRQTVPDTPETVEQENKIRQEIRERFARQMDKARAKRGLEFPEEDTGAEESKTPQLEDRE